MAVHAVIGVRCVLHITFWQLPVSIALKLIVQIFNSWRSVVELVVMMVYNVITYIFFGFVTEVCRPICKRVFSTYQIVCQKLQICLLLFWTSRSRTSRGMSASVSSCNVSFTSLLRSDLFNEGLMTENYHLRGRHNSRNTPVNCTLHTCRRENHVGKPCGAHNT